MRFIVAAAKRGALDVFKDFLVDKQLHGLEMRKLCNQSYIYSRGGSNKRLQEVAFQKYSPLLICFLFTPQELLREYFFQSGGRWR